MIQSWPSRQPAHFLARSTLVPVSAPLPDAAPLAHPPNAPRVIVRDRHSQDEFRNYDYFRQYANSAEQEIHTTELPADLTAIFVPTVFKRKPRS